MSVDFNLLKNTFRAGGETSVSKKLFCTPNQQELANLAEFIRMVGVSTKFAMKAHYELSGKNNREPSCEIEESMDYEPIEEEEFISFDEGWIESDEPMTFEEWLFDQDLHLDIKPDSIEFQTLEDLFNSMRHIEEIMQEEIDSHQTEMEYSECSYYPEYEQVTKALYTLIDNIRKS